MILADRVTKSACATDALRIADVTIRVPVEVRDQFAAVAEARGISLRAPMQDLAAQMLNPEQIQERADRTRAVLAERFGHDVTDEETAEMRRKMSEAAAAYRAADSGVGRVVD
ncbi:MULTISPECIES: hypothetical protein [Streptomyces]|uniref:hypothetical protein n=1 Tax=Streptomyces TaxID=1883 RepID=UPI001ED9F3B4|nr:MULTISPECIES: hypothetical protein [Streptomyces]